MACMEYSQTIITAKTADNPHCKQVITNHKCMDGELAALDRSLSYYEEQGVYGINTNTEKQASIL